MILLTGEEIASVCGVIEYEESARKAVRAQLKKVAEWGDLFCVELDHYGTSKYVDKRQRECRQCWQALKKEAGIDGEKE